jgi:deoxyribose-phosphate aldolase
VHPDLVEAAAASIAAREASDRLHLAAVATGFPAGRMDPDLKLEEVTRTLSAGADEVDIVIDRAAFLTGRYHTVYTQIRHAADACHHAGARLKTILETGELGSLDDVARAAALACWAGSDFVKTSTGKISTGATPESTYVLLRTVAIHAERTGQVVGVKASGGVRSAKDAVRYLVMVADVAGATWLDPHWFRFGASALANDLVAQRAHQRLGRYLGPDHFTAG